MDLFNLVAKLSLDKGEYEEGLTDAEQGAEQFSDAGVSALDKLKNMLVGAGIVAGIKAIGNAFQQAINQTAAYADTVDKGSQRLGISTRTYQEWDHALSQSGASISDLSRGILNLNSVIAGTATEDLTNAFNKVGVSVTDANGQMKDTETLLKDTILALADMEQTAERGDLVATIFGRGGAGLNAFLNSGAEGIQDLIDEATELGLVMSEDSIKNGVAYGDAVANLNAAVDAVKQSVVEGLLPALAQAIEFATKIVALFNGRGESSIADQMEEIDKSTQKAISDIEGTELQANGIIEAIEAMGDASQLTAEQFGLWRGYAEQLINLVPSLSDSINLQTGEIEGNTSALRENVAAWAEMAKRETYQKALDDKSQVLTEATQKLLDAQVEQNIAAQVVESGTQKALELAQGLVDKYGLQVFDMETGAYKNTVDSLDEASGVINRLQMDKIDDGDLRTLETYYNKIEEAQKALTKADELEKLREDVEAARAEYELYAEALSEIMGTAQTSAEGAESAVGELNTAIDNLPNGKTVTIDVVTNGPNIINGSHASGLDYVPFDGYIAELHRGERILTASEARQTGDRTNISELYAAVASAVSAAVSGIQINMDGKQVGNAVTDQVSRNIYQQQAGRRVGAV